MRRLLLHLALMSTALLALGCLLSPSRHISGTVRYPSGSPAFYAQVTSEMLQLPMAPGAITYTDVRGHYTLDAPPAGDTVRVYARDGFTGGVYGETHSGYARVVMGSGGATQDIVLDHSDPI